VSAMRVGFSLRVEQTQKLIMTPELRQAITILQLSALELTNYVQQELLENPVLEIREEGDRGETSLDEGRNAEAENHFDIDWEEYFSDRSDLGFVRQPREEYEERSYDNLLTQSPTLQEHLLFQLHLTSLGGREQEIGEFLIGNLDESGYLQISIAEVAERFGVAECQVEEVLKVIQGFDPPGVGARTLAECLLIQLRQMGKWSMAAEQIVVYHLEDLGKGRLNRIASHLGMTVKEIQEIADLIRSLNPRPGYQFDSGGIRYVVPDVVVERVGDEYVVLVNDTAVPRLGINSLYRSLLRSQQLEEQTRRFLERKMDSAAWLIRSIEQRRRTLYRVASCIVEIQRDFLDRGIKYLKPLNLKQVAEMIGVHESTVSRATANKFIQTPQGVFEFKFFFTSGVGDEEGAKFSSQSVKRMILELVEGENPARPLTDQKIAELLQKQGIPISRRTVAKYRSEAGIASASQRKRY